MKLLKFKKGGVHPSGHKQYTSDKAVFELAPPASVTLLLRQSIGASAKAVVKVGQHVKRGEMVAEPGGFVSVPLHSPVAGTVRKLEKVRAISGYWEDAIVIERDETDTAPAGLYMDIPDSEVIEALQSLSDKEIISRIRNAGLVGLGGASFPTHVKLSIPDGKRADTLLLNGAECEPFLTCDDRLMRERPEDILRGSLLLAAGCRARRIIVGIEANKPEAVAAMRGAAARLASLFGTNIEVGVLRTRYPQGSEKQLIQALTGRVVPEGMLPVDVNCVVDNVATAFSALQAVVAERPQTARIVTVTGPELVNPGNFVAFNGVSYSELLEAAGGVPEDTGKIISGGPMMGVAMARTEAPIVKCTGGVTVLPEEMSHRHAEQPCIRCGRCVDVCPMGLEPYLLLTCSRQHLQQEAERHNVMSCLECGCCSYSCPSFRPLLDGIRLSKYIIRKNRKLK